MTELTRVSILMPVKNTEKYLRRTLDSVRAQTCSDWELIAVNDGSADRSEEILNSYASKDIRIKVFQNDDAPGIIPALRTAYKKSSGRIVTRMDSDDLMSPDKLEKMRNTLTHFGRGHVVTGTVECFSDEGVKDGYRKYEAWLNRVVSSPDIYSEIYRECVIQSSCWMVFREDFDRAEGFGPEIYPEDYDLCFRFYKYGLKPVSAGGILHYWRDHPERVSRNDPRYADQQFFDLKLKYYYELERDKDRELVVWGAGQKGKKLVRKILDSFEKNIRWITDNTAKTGENIYGIIVENPNILQGRDKFQIIVAVSSPVDNSEIRDRLNTSSKNSQNGNCHFFC